ncbi:MAG TPA: CHAT domain-containing tetratricopeptide repeat protein [Gemmatimonadota bacterium]|nr:CHAT domain-containing tetratricopeptide repeat protein [Gemmatimonadota bacterium]
MSTGARRATAIEGKAQLLALLAEDPSAATPRLVRELWERVIALHRADARAAREVAECVWLVAERVGDLGSRALAHRALALAAIAAGGQRDALSEYESAERLYRELGQELERARVLRSMIDPLMHLGRYEEALAAGEEAGGVFRALDEPVLAAQVDANLGNVRHRLGRDAESLDAYDRALAAFRAAGDLDAAAVVEFNRANVFAGRGELADAERSYRAALRHYRTRGERLRESQCLYQLAYLAFLAARYSEALRGIEAVRRAVTELGDERHAALATLDEAELLLSLNAWEEAGDRAAEAGNALADLGLVQDALLAALFRGLSALHRKRWTEAADRLTEAEAGFRAEGNDVLAALACLYRAELALRRGDARPAARFAFAAVRTFAGRGLAAKEAYARIVAGRALWLLGRRAFAERQAERALERLAPLPSSEIRWRAQALLADVAAEPEERDRCLEAAIAESDRLRSQVVADELQAAFQRDKATLYERLAKSLLERGAFDAAFEIVDSARSRVLTERLAVGGQGDPPDADSVHIRATLDALNLLYRRQNEAERENAPRAAVDSVRAEIARREAELAGRHRSLQLERGKSHRAPGREALADLRGLLGPREAAVSYAFLEDRLHACAVDARGLRWTGPIASRAEIDAALGAWLFQAGKTALGEAYLSAHREALAAGANRALDRLHDLVWSPIAPLLDDPAELLLLPSGPLFYVPFHALRHSGGYLIERYRIATAPSAGVAVAMERRGPRGRGGNRDVVLGYEVPGLPAIAREVAAVAAALPEATVLVGADATREALHHARGARVLHLAAHAGFRADNPLLSSIELADGRLSFYDLFDLRLDADLVVLSGCQTGTSQVFEGDELMGLARGFQYAGTRALIASLWPVEDATAAGFMARLYGHLAADFDARTALAASMRDDIAEGRLPQEWAPFYLTGRHAGRERFG